MGYAKGIDDGNQISGCFPAPKREPFSLYQEIKAELYPKTVPGWRFADIHPL